MWCIFKQNGRAYALQKSLRGELSVEALGAQLASSSFLFHSEWPRANKAKHHLRWLLRYYNTHSKPQSVGSWMKISFRYCSSSPPASPSFRLARPSHSRQIDRRTSKLCFIQSTISFHSHFTTRSVDNKYETKNPIFLAQIVLCITEGNQS